MERTVQDVYTSQGLVYFYGSVVRGEDIYRIRKLQIRKHYCTGAALKSRLDNLHVEKKYLGTMENEKD
jgi:hypothetical protein